MAIDSPLTENHKSMQLLKKYSHVLCTFFFLGGVMRLKFKVWKLKRGLKRVEKTSVSLSSRRILEGKKYSIASKGLCCSENKQALGVPTVFLNQHSLPWSDYWLQKDKHAEPDIGPWKGRKVPWELQEGSRHHLPSAGLEGREALGGVSHKIAALPSASGLGDPLPHASLPGPSVRRYGL